MRGHIEELSDAEGGDFNVRASRILGEAPDPPVPRLDRSERKPTKIILKLSNGHSKNVPLQEPLPAKPRPRIIIKRPQRPVDLEEEAPRANPRPSSPLFEESEDEKRKSRKHGKKRHMRIEEYVNFPEPSSPSFVDWEDEEGGAMEEDEEDEEEERPRKSKKHKKKRREKLEMVDDSDDEDFDPAAEMRRKRSKARDSLVAAAPTLPNILVERIDLLGDEATNKNLHEISRPAAVVPVVSSGLGQRSDDNPIIKTLQKCHRIAASLKSELKATSTSDDAVNVDRYAEVDASAAKIVSQVWLSRRQRVVLVCQHLSSFQSQTADQLRDVDVPMWIAWVKVVEVAWVVELGGSPTSCAPNANISAVQNVDVFVVPGRCVCCVWNCRE